MRYYHFGVSPVNHSDSDGKKLLNRLNIRMFSLYPVYLYFWIYPILVSRGRLCFLLHKFLVIAYPFTYIELTLVAVSQI